MSMLLKDKVCLLTGGYGVLGSSIARSLAREGVKVVIMGRDKDKAEQEAQAIRELGTEALGLACDVLDKPALESCQHRVLEAFGDFHFLINGAGGNHPSATAPLDWITSATGDLSQSFFGLQTEGFDQVFDVNFKGTLLPSMVFGAHLINKREGVILNISSMNAYRPLTRIPAYSAAKAAINNFTEWMAVHFAKVNVRVNGIAPGFFLTDQNRFLLTERESGALTDRGQKILDHTPMERFGQPEDLHGAVQFLLSDAAAFITGVTLPVDGGFNAYSGV